MPDASPDLAAFEKQPPLLPRGAEFRGLVVIHGSACIEGRVQGEIIGAQHLEIGEAGAVEARVEAEEVVVAGCLVGEVRARRRVELRATARVSGTIETPRLALEDGALFEGRCRTGAGRSS